MSVKFTDNRIQAKSTMNSAIYKALEEASAEFESQVKRNTKGGGSGLRDKWQHVVDAEKQEAVVGNPLELAIWYEFGTGILAQNGDGRKDVPWTYQDSSGQWHKTSGMEPRRPLQQAQASVEPKVRDYFEKFLKGI